MISEEYKEYAEEYAEKAIREFTLLDFKGFIYNAILAEIEEKQERHKLQQKIKKLERQIKKLKGV